MTVRVDEIIALFRNCIPFAVRDESAVRRILSDGQNKLFYRQDEAGKLIAVSVIMGNAVLLFCVEPAHRGRGIGSEMLRESEEYVRSAGFDEIVIGAGAEYLVPGVPTNVMPFKEELCPAKLYETLNDDACLFFTKRGYGHSWEQCNCFDMRLDLTDFDWNALDIGGDANGMTYRWAEKSEMDAVCDCVSDAFPKFVQYYKNAQYYEADSSQRVLAAFENERVCGALMVAFESEGAGLGSIGCTAVRSACQGRGIATNLVLLGTRMLKESGLPRAFLGYTYSGLDVLYGRAGYRICIYYNMAKKSLK